MNKYRESVRRNKRMGASIIKKAIIQDIPEIIGILENRVNWLKERRINQWNDGYTSKYN